MCTMTMQVKATRSSVTRLSCRRTGSTKCGCRTRRDNRATNVLVTIHHVEGKSTVKVNQRNRPSLESGVHSLGTFSFASDKPASVEISTADTDGYVIADAVQWVAVNEPPDVILPNTVSSSKTIVDAGSKPNIVVILADDLGIECLSSYGGNHQTPNIDKLATQGMRFTHCFSNPYCSPSRANLLTGRYPFKNGLKEVLWNRRQEDLTCLRINPVSPDNSRRKDTPRRLPVSGMCRCFTNTIRSCVRL